MKIHKKKPLELVRVIWVDAEEQGETGWNDFKSIQNYARKPCPIMHSVGYVIYRDDEHISLISSMSMDRKNSSSCEKIPITFVKEIVVLSPQKGKNK